MRNRIIKIFNTLIRPTGMVLLPAKTVVELCQEMAAIRAEFQSLVALRQLELQARINQIRMGDDQTPEYWWH